VNRFFNDFIKSISKDFKIKNLGVIKDYLGINININKDSIKLGQSTYINKVLNKNNLQDTKIKSTPMDSNIKLEPYKGQANKEDNKLF
jgi:hypothetical protein